MQRRAVSLVLCVLLLFVLVSCKKTSQVQGDTPKDVVQPQNSPPLESLVMAQMNQYTYDLDADGAKEIITLYSDVEVSKAGEYMWDDGQRWLLLVQDGKKYYPLVSQYVQLGKVFFTLSFYGEDKLPSITAFILTSNNDTLCKFTYNAKNKVFMKERVYDSGILNTFYSTIPSY